MNKRKTSITSQWRRYAATFISAAKNAGLSQEDVDACLSYAKPICTRGFPVIYDALHFSMLVGYELHYLYGVTNAPHSYYRVYQIKKKSGGMREIAEPLPSLKEIQRWILDEILGKVPVSPAAKAFIKGRSIKENARFHRGQNTIVQVDVEDFFPSIDASRVYSAFKNIGYSQPVCTLLTKLCCLDDRLPQGAPTSPALSNIVFKVADERFLGFARLNNLRYTRYADDITFSGDGNPGIIIPFCQKVLAHSGFVINDKKTRVLRRGQRQSVTGVVVNEKLQAPRDLRRKIRQAAYYIERYGLEAHAARLQINCAHYREHLLGLAGFVLWLNKDDRDARDLIEVLISR